MAKKNKRIKKKKHQVHKLTRTKCRMKINKLSKKSDNKNN